MDNKIVYVVSDSVGETADLVVRAAMGQFPFAPDIRRTICRRYRDIKRSDFDC